VKSSPLACRWRWKWGRCEWDPSDDARDGAYWDDRFPSERVVIPETGRTVAEDEAEKLTRFGVGGGNWPKSDMLGERRPDEEEKEASLRRELPFEEDAKDSE
jgi:hypothetical protein